MFFDDDYYSGDFAYDEHEALYSRSFGDRDFSFEDDFLDDFMDYYSFEAEEEYFGNLSQPVEPTEVKLNLHGYMRIVSKLKDFLIDRRYARKNADGPPNEATFIKRRAKRAARRMNKSLLQHAVISRSI